MAYCIHTLLLKDALSIFTVLVEQNYTFTLRKSEENLYSWIHILLLKDALSIFTLLVEQDFNFYFEEIWRKSVDFLSHTLGLLYTYIVSKEHSVYIYSMGRIKEKKILREADIVAIL